MLNHTATPKMSRHALARCKEMGIPARIAKAIYRDPAIVRPADQGKPTTHPMWMVVSDVFPDYAIVVAEDPRWPVVITVLFRTGEQYDRNGDTFTPKK